MDPNLLWTSDVITDLQIFDSVKHPEHKGYIYHIESVNVYNLCLKPENLISKLLIEWKNASNKGDQYLESVMSSYLNAIYRVTHGIKYWMIVLRIMDTHSISLWDGRHRLYIFTKLYPDIEKIPVVVIHPININKLANEVLSNMIIINSDAKDVWRDVIGAYPVQRY